MGVLHSVKRNLNGRHASLTVRPSGAILISLPAPVRISEPDLELLAQGRPLPHIYTNPLRLCLHLPGTEDWDSTKRIDQTIIPWTYTSDPDALPFPVPDWLAALNDQAPETLRS